ncbi:MAG: cytochrome d ubiquinol oxidase subunit II [Clostridium sp.]|nr:cytochrome d ubiquinol oxidase subunit II [Clostridium sp.]
MYTCLQQYWWFIISLLGGILVFLLFVQGGNSLLFCLGKTERERRMMVNSTGRKWEFTFTTLVTFGGAFFASFPLFYSTSFGGAYWLWMLILFTFVLQAVSYEFQSRAGNLLGRGVYRAFLVLNGVAGPVLLGVAVSTFFTGADFAVDKGGMADLVAPVVSRWTGSWYGLEALAVWRNLLLGLAVFFLARMNGALYFINNIEEAALTARCRRSLWGNAGAFLLLFVGWLVALLLADGYAVDDSTGTVFLQPHKYALNLWQMPWVAGMMLMGVVMVLAGLVRTLYQPWFERGIWWTGIGTVLTVTALLLLAGYNHTAYYPSLHDAGCSLTLSNSCSGLFTLKVMTVVSVLIPFVLAYIVYAWRCIDRRKITDSELEDTADRY